MVASTLLILLCWNLLLVSSVPVKRAAKAATCHSCHATRQDRINVHLIPHSHDDVGWLKTVDQYYYGSGSSNNYADAGVQFIIGSAVEALRSHPDRRFIQVETAFFWKWWQNQNEHVKQDVVDLVNSGQLEIINGAWSMNDEASTHYHSIIDQYTWGFRILNDTLGECARPKVGWQIDPFGHSREHASLLKQLGFQGLVVGRIDYRDKEHRRASTNLDLLWQASTSLDLNLFTSMFPDLYVWESGFCFDISCQDRFLVDDEESPDYNLKEKVDEFASKMDAYVNYYKTNNLLIPMGADFNYQASEINFANIDKLIKGFIDHDTYNVIYSTPSCYIQAVNDELVRSSTQLSQKTDDFFPYASDFHSFWTGYFSSRPTLKRYERQANNILQSAKQLASFSKVNGKDVDENLNELRAALGIMQHHDAITGTEKQAVANDYARLVSKALHSAEASVSPIIGDLLRKDADAQVDLQLSTCLLSNVSICLATQQDRFLVAVQNPLPRSVTHYVHLPVDGDSYSITGPDGEEVYDIFDSIHSFDYVQEEVKPSSKDLVFSARDVPPLGVKLYYVERTEAVSNVYKPFKTLAADDSYFGTETNGFRVDTSSGQLVSVTINAQTLNITQDFFYYTSNNGDDGNRASGAYVFRPSETEAIPIATRPLGFMGARGELSDQFIQVLNDEVTQIIRVYKDDAESYIEFDWLVGDLQFVDRKGKEVITRFTVSDFANEATFYTDSNGREQIKREKNTRPDYDYDSTEEPVSSNYYPVTTKIVIKDETRELEVAVLTDRAQGGSSLGDGLIELMVHRRCTRDDNFGVVEILSEKQYDVGLYVRGQHYLTFGPTTTISDEPSTAAFERQLAQRKLLQPWILVADATSDDFNSLEKVQTLVDFKFEGLAMSLPVNIQLLTLEPWKEDTYILRFEHILEKNEDDTLSQTTTIDLNNLFTTFDISDITEMTLGANELVDDYNDEDKFVWNDIVEEPLPTLDSSNPLLIELSPMQIRTFIVKVVKKTP